jgi:hypothetical protein
LVIHLQLSREENNATPEFQPVDLLETLTFWMLFAVCPLYCAMLQPAPAK